MRSRPADSPTSSATSPPAEELSPALLWQENRAAGNPLLQRAIRDKAVAPHVTFHDLLTLAVGIALATEHHEDPDTQAGRLFRLAVEGLSPPEHGVAGGASGNSGSSVLVTESLPDGRL